MLGIQTIASYIPAQRISNYARMAQLGFDETFIENKLGIHAVAVKAPDEETSDLCVRAFQNLAAKVPIDPAAIDVAIVITQNPDVNIPHTAAIVHGKLGLSEHCACFDISLGCSGFVYGLSALQSLMAANGMHKGLLFTADPYSKIIDANDKNTASLFGDAATVTLVSGQPKYCAKQFTFGTIGASHEQLQCVDGILTMNGRGIFNFAAQYVPVDIRRLLEMAGLPLSAVDRFVFHQGSKYIVDTITKRLKVAPEKVVFGAQDYGNTVSSSIPLLLEQVMDDVANQNIVISGFGVGLSWASTLLNRTCVE